MKKRFFIILGVVFIGTIFIYYLTFSEVKKNQVKNFILHKTGVLSSEWIISTVKKNKEYVTKFKSPTLYVDNIYTSMKGPHTNEKFKLNEKEDDIYWVTKFKGIANSKFNSNDFICHMNLFHSNIEHFSRLGFQERINIQDSRLITLTKGALSIEFPKGFGYPIYSNEKMFISSQALNLYKKDERFNVDFDFELHYFKNENKKLKPLYMKYLVLSLPYKNGIAQKTTSDTNNPILEELVGAPFVECAAPSSDKRFEATNDKGETFTAFWKVPPGEHVYINDVTKILDIKKTETIHFINIHAHPYANSLELIDKTEDRIIFKSIITNSKGRKGIEKMTNFSSIKGVKLYPNHKYVLKQKVNNILNIEVDMMASMFIYFYDEELDLKLNKS